MKIQISQHAVHRKVVDGVYNTHKMLLTLGEERVTKHFKSASKSTSRRYRIEKKALTLLRNTKGVPFLYESDDQTHTLEMSRLPGHSAKFLNEKNLKDLAVIVEDMLDVGIARHSMPIRDVVVDEQDHVGLVDFERVTIRRHRWRPDWLISKAVARFNLYRLTYLYQPQLLTPGQLLQIYIGSKLRVFVVFIHSLSK
ncbi:hypothetical protein [Celerinatantimonas sp. YJH-8]|uniref:hypothetical protein n=1 Tax=Celerinatantimonas sp. YJH-8 TaxID=3228714 RepID=UPI0038C4F9F5